MFMEKHKNQVKEIKSVLIDFSTVFLLQTSMSVRPIHADPMEYVLMNSIGTHADVLLDILV